MLWNSIHTEEPDETEETKNAQSMPYDTNYYNNTPDTNAQNTQIGEIYYTKPIAAKNSNTLLDDGNIPTISISNDF